MTFQINFVNIITMTPGPVAQSVASSNADLNPGLVFPWDPVWSTTFIENDHEIISTVILSSFSWFKKGWCQLQAKVCARSTG